MIKNLFIKIIRGFIDLIDIACEELRNIYRDRGVMIIFFAASLLYPILYSFVYKNEVYENAPIAVVDKSNTSLSREFTRKMDATPEVNVIFKCTTMEEAKKLYNNREIVGFVIIPNSFSDDINYGKQTHVSVYNNMSSMMYYKALYASANFVALDMGDDIQIKNLFAQGITAKQAEISASPIKYNGYALYNTQNGFASFLLPPVLILMIQQTLILGIGILAGTAREENKFHELIPIQRKYHGTLRLVLGKSLSYLLLYSFISLFVLVLIPRTFNFPQLANPNDLILFLLPYLLAVIFFGMTISVFFKNRESPFLLFLFTSVIFLFMSGYSWPESHIHPMWKIISYTIPSTFGISGYIKMSSMGASINQVSLEFFSLWLQTGIYFILACIVYRWQIKNSEKIKLN